MNNLKVKILIGYHKPAVLIKDDIFVPIHLGRALTTKASKDGAMSREDYQWMLDNMIGDDTGENISSQNQVLNELTAMYWAWKNYNELGNPDYIGFMHYRRHFIFDDKIRYHLEEYNHINNEYLNRIKLDNILDILPSYDIIINRPYHWNDNVINQYKNSPYHHLEDLQSAVDILCAKYPQMSETTKAYKEYPISFIKITEETEEILFKNLNTNNAMVLTFVRETANYFKNKIRYWRYHLLSKITFGKKRKKYKQKRKELKARLKQVRAFLKVK